MAEIKKKGQQTTANSDGGHSEKDGTEERKATDSPENNCRCKEVSEKTLPEMFRLMISDLSFWKKTKGKK